MIPSSNYVQVLGCELHYMAWGAGHARSIGAGPSPVPEPAAYALLSIGLAGIFAMKRRAGR